MLARSIKARGLLQPLVVTPNASGYYLVDGHRRLAACQQAGVVDIPVVIRDESDETEQLIDAVTTSAQRVDLSIVEEARAFARMRQSGKPVKQIAAELGVSQKLVSQRLAMLTLPDFVLELVKGGALQPGHLGPLVEMAKVSPGLATGVATVVVDQQLPPAQFVAKPLGRVGVGHVPELDVWIVTANHPAVSVSSVSDDLSDETVHGLSVLAKEAGHMIAVDVDAAIAYGCVYTPADDSEPWSKKHALCDRKVVVQLVTDAVARRVADLDPSDADAGPSVSVGGGYVVDGDGVASSPPVALSEEQLKEQRRAERNAELADRLKAHAVNLNLGAELFTEVAELSLDRELALQLARMAIRDEARDLFLSGLRFCQPQYSKEVERKAGPAKLDFELPARDDQAQAVWDFLERGDTGEQVLGRLFQVLGMSALADQTVVAMSSRPGRPDSARDVDEYVAGLVGSRLPVPIRERLDADAATRAEHQAAREAARAEHVAELERAADQDDQETAEREDESNFPASDSDPE